MTITITKNNVIGDARLKSHLEVATIEPADLRYKIEAGAEKDDELYQSLQDAHNALVHICRRFITPVTETTGSDDLETSDDSYVYNLTLSARREQTIAGPLAKAMHAYLVDSVLNKFYISVSQDALANAHERKMLAKQGEIEDLLYTKMQPTY